MYFEALAIAAELRDFPGGPKALATSIYPTIEGMRIIRWPADRLDTLGGYLAYHNIVLFNFFLAIFASIQGARLVRHLEESRDVEFFLATGLSRNRLVVIRTISYAIAQLVISFSLGIATAYALVASDSPNTLGAIITLLAGGICIFPFFGLGLLISQYFESARTAAGITAVIVTFIYVLDNISGKYGWLDWFSYISPFHYANLSRPVIPGFQSNYLSWLLMIAVGLVLVLMAIRIFAARDIGSTSVKVRERRNAELKSSGFVPKGLVGDFLWRQRIGLLAWTIATSSFIGVFVAMMGGILDIWREFAFLEQFASFGLGTTPEEQYLAMVYEILPPFLTAFIITQGARWTADLNQGRVQLFLSAPISWSGLIFRRVIATIIGSWLIISFAIATATIGAVAQGIDGYVIETIRVLLMLMLFVLAFTSATALLVAMLRRKNMTQVISIYVGAAWLIGFMAPYLDWPSWVVRFSIFDALGHPFVEMPSRFNLALMLMLAIPGLFLATRIAERSPKSQ
jgi:ABC-2 type transport system permease protein